MINFINEKLSSSEQKKAMKEIKTKIENIQKKMDTKFEQYINDDIPNKIIELNKLSQKVPNLFNESLPIKVNIINNKHDKNNKNNKKSLVISPPRKRRKLSKNNDDDDNNDNNDNEDEEQRIWFKKSQRTLSEIARLETNVEINESMNKISNLISNEIIEMINITTKMKMSISLKIPSIQEGNNFGVEIQEDIVDDLSRAENGALDAIDQISNYYQIRSKSISKILKWPFLDDYRIALNKFDISHLAVLKSMAVDLRNSYIILHDTITKNMEKLKNPREERAKYYLY